MYLNKPKLDDNTTNASAWFQFFKDCNLPETIARNYSILFANNRMRFDMINELNKEILHEIGICAIGDVLSILKHANQQLTKATNNSTPKPIADNMKSDSKQQYTNFLVSKRIIESNTNPTTQTNKNENGNLSSNLMSRLKFKSEATSMDTGSDEEEAVHNNNNNNNNNNIERISIKTDTRGNRIVVKANNDNLSTGQTKLLSIKKPIIKRTVSSSNTSASSMTTTVLRNNDDKQGHVALRLLGDFIRKPTVDLKSITTTTNNNKKAANSDDRPILKRLKF